MSTSDLQSILKQVEEPLAKAGELPAADGGLGGFSAPGGLRTKGRLLALEHGEDVRRATYGEADLCVTSRVA